MIAYYCFVNFGWTPSQYDNLSLREKILVSQFVAKESTERKKIKDTNR